MVSQQRSWRNMEIEWQAEVIWCNLTIVGRLTYCAHCFRGSIHGCHFRFSAQSQIDQTRRSCQMITWREAQRRKQEGGWERATAWKWFSGSFYSRCLSVLVDETTKARSNTSPRKRKKKHEFNFNCCAFRSPQVWRFFLCAVCSKSQAYSKYRHHNFTSSYIFTARRFSPLRSEFVFLLLLLEFLFVRFCFAVHSSITY